MVRDLDFQRIRPIGPGGQRDAFEELVCQLVRHASTVPENSVFERYRGAGGDTGVECLWRLANGDEWGWQSKFFSELDKAQLDASVNRALTTHPSLSRYIFCFPFDLTGGPRKRGKSNLQKLSDWSAQWKASAAQQGMTVQFAWMGETELRDDLLRIDPEGGRQRYFFDAKVLGRSWFDSQVDRSVTEAGPRYTPQLRVDVPIGRVIGGLAADPDWRDRSLMELAGLESVNRRLRDGDRLDAQAPDGMEEGAAESAAQKVALAIDAIRTWLEGPDLSTLSSATARTTEATEACTAAVDELTSAFEAKHGPGRADSAGFRQWMAEYQNTFPAVRLDAARDALRLVSEWGARLSSSESASIALGRMCMTGVAGAGKTHSLCDTAVDRRNRGLLSLVLFSRAFQPGNPIPQIRDLLGLPGDMSADEMLSALDSAAESNGSPLLFCIDALNEGPAIDSWQTHLPALIHWFSKYRNLRLLVSVRTSYLDRLIPEALELPLVEHGGFKGVEFDAVFEFVRHYELESPSSPLVQPEFSNPLYLTLVCKALKTSGRRRLPDQSLGLTEVIAWLLSALGDQISKRLGARPQEKIVERAIQKLSKAMIREGKDFLEWDAAAEELREIWPSQPGAPSLFLELVNEGILKEDRTTKSSNNPIDIVSFGFERLGQHLIVGAQLASLESKDQVRAELQQSGALRQLLGNPIDAGLLEALAIQVAERYETELIDLVSGDLSQAAEAATLTGLTWRKAPGIGEPVIAVIQRALNNSEAFPLAMETVFSLAVRPDIACNAEWLTWLFKTESKGSREAWLLPWLYQVWGTYGAVDRLIRWGRRPALGSIDSEVAKLWGLALAWCCASNQRGIRDEASRALVGVLRRQPSAIAPLLAEFLHIDDDYILERVLLAAYGALLCLRSPEVTRETSRRVWHEIFSRMPPANALARDYGRGILDLALTLGVLPQEAEVAKFRPPYDSPWPMDWPTEQDVQHLANDEQYPRLRESCLNDDFGRYQIERLTRNLQGVDDSAAKRWVLKRAGELDYMPHSHAWFDKYLLAKYGPGRGRKREFERVGKKNQWIALHQLAGVLGDHAEQDPRFTDKLESDDLQALKFRDMDPTVDIQAVDIPARSQWQPSIAWPSFAALTDWEWVQARNDIPDLVLECEGRILLAAQHDWTFHSKPPAEHPYRWMQRQIYSFLVNEAEAGQVWTMLGGLDHSTTRLGLGGNLYRGFAGEYPFASAFRPALASADESFDTRIGTPTTHTLSGEYEYDASQNSFHIYVPWQGFFADPNLVWDSTGGWKCDESLIFSNASLDQEPMELTVDGEYIRSCLCDRRQELFWVEMLEKMVVTASSSSAGRLVMTRAYHLSPSGMRRTEGIMRTQPPIP